MILEVCVDSTASALAAKRGGADRLELCADLIVGGTTPSLALVRQVKAETGLPVRALLRPRFGDFCYDRYELAQMEQLAVRAAKEKAEDPEAFTDNIIMYEVLSELKDIAARGGIRCRCGSTRYGIQVHRDSVDLCCQDCGGKLRLPAATDEDLDRLCCQMTLTIPGRA